MAVPQESQKPRSTFSDEACCASVPWTALKSVAGNVAHATKGAPDARRQLRQWQ